MSVGGAKSKIAYYNGHKYNSVGQLDGEFDIIIYYYGSVMLIGILLNNLLNSLLN